MMPSWLVTTLPIAMLFAFRMLGLFMLVPIFTVYANHLNGATPQLLGLALGGYGLTQGILQIPFGLLSDRFGRKPLITIGLILFAIGSLLGAFTQHIYGMILARILQGSGAVGSVLIALLADTTPAHDRTKAMAVIGGVIALSFSLAFILSPILAKWMGLSGIFYLTAALATLGLLMLYAFIPHSTHDQHSTINGTQLKQIFYNSTLLRLDAGIFFQHAILVSTFFVLPMLIQHHIQWGHLTQAWHLYLPILFGSFLIMAPLLVIAEKTEKVKFLLLGSIILIGLCQWGLSKFGGHFYSLALLLMLYFVAFNCLEANLPSLISKCAPEKLKGGAMGVYSSSQFLGIFVGGCSAGFIYHRWGAQGVFIINGIAAVFWGVLMWPLNIKPLKR